ncbi:MAG: Sucrose-6-phosphate hydrolase [Candidatus Erwinia impunctatus]
MVGQPEGYTGHIRDPKVWRHDGQWYMVLAAQDLELQGKVLLLRSEDLTEWTLLGEIAGSGLGGIARFGYMWECTDLFILENKEVLITCPQGVDAEARRYLNQYQSGYFVGDLDYDTGRYQHGPFTELDYGHEFYAPQTTQTEDGRRLLIGWMGVPDQDEFSQPTIRHGWLHIMTCPRELTLQGELLYQRPARELQSLRDQYQRYTDVANAVPECAVTQAELVIKTDGVFQANFADTLWLHCEDEGVTLLRKGLLDGADEYRYWPGKVETLQILCDSSSIEIFINDGEGVMSSRYFPAKPATVTFSGEAQLEVEHWLLRKAATGIDDN